MADQLIIYLLSSLIYAVVLAPYQKGILGVAVFSDVGLNLEPFSVIT